MGVHCRDKRYSWLTLAPVEANALPVPQVSIETWKVAATNVEPQSVSFRKTFARPHVDGQRIDLPGLHQLRLLPATAQPGSRDQARDRKALGCRYLIHIYSAPPPGSDLEVTGPDQFNLFAKSPAVDTRRRGVSCG
jgi:hypothetical protein